MTGEYVVFHFQCQLWTLRMALLLGVFLSLLAPT